MRRKLNTVAEKSFRNRCVSEARSCRMYSRMLVKYAILAVSRILNCFWCILLITSRLNSPMYLLFGISSGIVLPHPFALSLSHLSNEWRNSLLARDIRKTTNTATANTGNRCAIHLSQGSFAHSASSYPISTASALPCMRAKPRLRSSAGSKDVIERVYLACARLNRRLKKLSRFRPLIL